ncbi:MAG: DUF512 domain-containing protein [Clostridia bacterium]|nr:DUF512 domain-containing protein [Clostridia bacterium]
MKHRISGVDSGSIAEELGVKAGSELVSINGEEIVDLIDYEQLCANERLTLRYIAPDGVRVDAQIEKYEDEPLGISFSDDLLGGVRSCRNHCVFCFIDQMPRGGRDTLHVKDDDWRMSLIMGNYVTLTNVSESEFCRIIKRKASPLYVSVHALDPKVRQSIMGNPSAGLIGERLERLRRAGIAVHCQIVLCPGLNDGATLRETLRGLCELYPSVRSVAVVPVGLTKFRDGLYPLRALTCEEARAAVTLTEEFARDMRAAHGTSVVYCTDEMYIIAGMQLPPYEYYEDFQQLENGAGMYRKLERELKAAIGEHMPFDRKRRIDVITGTAIADMLGELFGELRALNIDAQVHAVVNHSFGETVTVAGLVCANDIVRQLKGKLSGELVVIPSSMLREREPLFLDSVTLDELSSELELDVRPLCAYDGCALLDDLYEILND